LTIRTSFKLRPWIHDSAWLDLKGNFDYNAWLNAMARSGYSTSPTAWKAKIRTQIITYNLTELNALNGSTKQP
jgi:hypothetical protein